MAETPTAPDNETANNTSKYSTKGLRNLIDRTRQRMSSGEGKKDQSFRESILRTSNQIGLEELEKERKLKEEAEAASTVDHLTGLHNKKWFEEELTRRIAEARRQNDQLWLIYADIDHFKIINDKYGHPVGDEVLRAFGALGSADGESVVRIEEPIARIGGEEFAQIIQRGLDSEDIYNILERYSTAFKVSSKSILGYAATLSFGVVELSQEDTPLSIVQKADKALYHSKESGRDRATLLRGSLESPYLKPIEFIQVPQEAIA
jgi:diguanylate cyclase (GGDEF)-like protein